MQSDQVLNIQRNRLVAAIGGIVFLAFLGILYVQFFMPVHAHYHAGFQVYVDGVMMDFSKLEYMKEAPCVVPGTPIKEDEQLEKAHLHDGAGTVVHSHRTRAKWRDLFINLKYSFDSEKPLESYVNGEKIKNIFDYPIKPYDSVVILVGQHGPVQDYLSRTVTKAQILTEEKKSENCGGS